MDTTHFQYLHIIWLALGLVCWASFCATQGIRDARFYSMKFDCDKDLLVEKLKMSIIKQSREFPLFTMDRLSVYILVALVKIIAIFYNTKVYGQSDINILIFCILLIPLLMFPFIHDGHYYKERNSQDGSYKDKWLTNNSKRWGMPWWLRVILFVFAILLFIWEVVTILF